MVLHSAQDLFSRRLGDVHSSACFLARHIPSMVSATGNTELRRLLNLYLDVVRDNADRSEGALDHLPPPGAEHEPVAVPAMIDELFDLIERIEDPSLVDTAIAFLGNEIGAYEAQRFRLLAAFAQRIGRREAIAALQEGSDCLSEICEQLKAMLGDDMTGRQQS